MARKFEDFTGVKMEFRWLGTSRTFSDEKIQQVAILYSAEEKLLSLRKKIVPKVDVYSELTSVKNAIRKYWVNSTLPYIEKGVRLLPIDAISSFDRTMSEYREQLRDLAQQFRAQLPHIVELARAQLGALFNSEEYNIDEDCFDVNWKYLSLSVPEYIQSHQEVYERETERLRQQVEEVILLAKATFLEELKRLTGHLIERLTPEDGKVKRLRREVLENFHTFFERFKSLNIANDQELTQIIEEAKKIISGTDAQTLRENTAFAEHIRNQMAAVHESVDKALSDPDIVSVVRRRIL